MQTQRQKRTFKTPSSKKQQLVQGPSGKYYIRDEAGRIIDPDTGITFDPYANLLYDPSTGFSIDLTSGTMYDIEGNPIGKVPLSTIYGITPNVSTTQSVESIKPRLGQTSSQTRQTVTPMVSSSKPQQMIRGPSGKYYIRDEAGRIIDPDTGVTYDPSTNTLYDPSKGLTIDLNTGAVYDSAGNLLGRVSMSDIYKMTPNVSTTQPWEEIKSGAKMSAGLMYSTLKKATKAVVRTLDALAEGYASANALPSEAEKLAKRLEIAYSRLDDEAEFIKDVVARAIKYVNEYKVGIIRPKQFIKKMYGEVNDETEKKIVAVLKYLWDAKVVPPRDAV